MSGENAGEAPELTDSPGNVDGLTQWSERVCGKRAVTRIVVAEKELEVEYEPLRLDLDCGHSVEPPSDTIGHNRLRGIRRRGRREVEVVDPDE